MDVERHGGLVGGRAATWLARSAGVVAWLLPAAWYGAIVNAFVLALEYAAATRCGNPIFSLHLVVVASAPVCAGSTIVARRLVEWVVGTRVVRAERPLRHGWLAGPIFASLFLAAAGPIGTAAEEWFPQDLPYELSRLRTPLDPRTGDLPAEDASPQLHPRVREAPAEHAFGPG
jgi:hypothetical protein